MALKDEVALVTGASRGIGAAIADTLAADGAIVVGTATSTGGADAIAARFKAKGLTGHGRVLNVTDSESVDALMSWMKEQTGSPSILVNNAGITRDNLLMRMKDDEWDAIISTNLSSVFRMSKACMRPMMKAKKGRIVNITSVVGATGNPGQTNYAAAKAGVVGFTRSLAREVGSRNITVNSVAPGFIDTDMTRALDDTQRDAMLASIPLNRFGSVDDVAHAVSYLVSPAASYVTGTVIHVNGGMYMG